ncbi:MAG: acylneuraminate cytidylyltransferase family protein [Longimicrobiales bacterium]
MNTVALVCARGGSKGLPGKNTRALGGRPLIAWAIMQARAVSRVDRVIVSTDSEEIAAVAREVGAEVPFMRPAELATDTAAEWLVWQHALSYLKSSGGRYPDALMVVPATAPLRSPEDLSRCLDNFALGAVDTVITVTPARRSPYFNMVTSREDGYVGLVVPPPSAVVRRQDTPPVFDMTTVGYVCRPDFVMRSSGLFEGRVRAVSIPVERALDIDTQLDFDLAEWLMRKNLSIAEGWA